jgi:hypothetical protein
MAPQPQHSSPVSVFGPLVAQGMSVWSAEADAWPLSDAPEDTFLLAAPVGVLGCEPGPKGSTPTVNPIEGRP